jgi:alkylation response protein AidB-like acyl-CoA dehydrogenase
MVRAAEAPVLAEPYRTARRLELQAEAREFAMDEVLPIANELDPQKAEMPPELIKQLGAKGYFGIRLPEDVGGLGLGVFEYCMITEELARAWMSVASIIARAQGMGTGHATGQRRVELLRRSAAGEWIGAAALSEPTAGSDLAGVRTTAVRVGDEWVLNGEKRWCGNAINSHFIQLLCRERDARPGESRSAGLMSVVIEKEPGTVPDGMVATEIDKIGYHGFKTFNLELHDVRIPLGARVGSGDLTARTDERPAVSAFKATQRGLNDARVHTAARAVGLARAAVEDCTAYLQQREQFGQPLSDFQALRFELAMMAARVEQARSFYQHVAHRLDQGEPCEKEAAMVKLVATEMAVEVTGQGIQLHGGNGYTTERQVERHWRDARLTTIFEGTSQIQQHIISERMLGKAGRG